MFYEVLMAKSAKRSKESYATELALLDKKSKSFAARGGLGGILLGKMGINTTNQYAEAVQRRKDKLLKERNRMYGRELTSSKEKTAGIITDPDILEAMRARRKHAIRTGQYARSLAETKAKANAVIRSGKYDRKR